MNCSWSFCTVRKVISYFFRFLITILVKDTFYRLKMLSESSWHFRCLWSAGAKSKHSFYPSNSGITAIPPFSFFNQLLCNFPIKDTQVQKTAIAPASFFTYQPCIWDLLCQADSRSFSLGLFALQLSWFTLSCPANSLLVPCTVFKNKRTALLWSIT